MLAIAASGVKVTQLSIRACGSRARGTQNCSSRCHPRTSFNPSLILRFLAASDLHTPSEPLRLPLTRDLWPLAVESPLLTSQAVAPHASRGVEGGGNI